MTLTVTARLPVPVARQPRVGDGRVAAVAVDARVAQILAGRTV